MTYTYTHTLYNVVTLIMFMSLVASGGGYRYLYHLWHHDTGINGYPCLFHLVHGINGPHCLFNLLHGLVHIPLGLLGSGVLRCCSMIHWFASAVGQGNGRGCQEHRSGTIRNLSYRGVHDLHIYTVQCGYLDHVLGGL